jgi:hypothetical protein
VLERAIGGSHGGSASGGAGPRAEEYEQALQVLSVPLFSDKDIGSLSAAADPAPQQEREDGGGGEAVWTIGAALRASSGSTLSRTERAASSPPGVAQAAVAPASSAARGVSGAGVVNIKLLWGRYGYRMDVPGQITLPALQSALCHRIGKRLRVSLRALHAQAYHLLPQFLRAFAQRVAVRACACVRVRVCARVRARACVRVCVRVSRSGWYGLASCRIRARLAGC